MQDFLVRIDVALPAGMGDDEIERLMDAERARGAQLRDAGSIQRIWRLPGGLRNVGVWRARDATDLHALVTSLPFSRWCTVDVDALAIHPLEADDG